MSAGREGGGGGQQLSLFECVTSLAVSPLANKYVNYGYFFLILN